MVDTGKHIILTIGLPQSSKSTWARDTRLPIVNRDSIRKAIGGTIRYFEEEEKVSEIERVMVLSLLYSGADKVIIDATNLKYKYRLPWIELAEKEDIDIYYMLFPIDLELSIQRAEKNFPQDTDFPAIIHNMYQNFYESGDGLKVEKLLGFYKTFIKASELDGDEDKWELWNDQGE